METHNMQARSQKVWRGRSIYRTAGGGGGGGGEEGIDRSPLATGLRCACI